MEPLTQRPQRTTAGKTSKFADFSVVSFPQLKRHLTILKLMAKEKNY
jgi:hypothetical protein